MSKNKNTDQQADGFSEAWLSLREPADHDARDKLIGAELTQWARAQSTINIFDLGAGTGSNLRFLAPLLGHDQHWTLIDIDERLLAELPRLLSDWATQKRVDIVTRADTVHLLAKSFTATIECKTENLATGLRNLSFGNAQLVTASALLDLTSARWLDELVDHCVASQCAMLFALNYDGMVSWEPEFEHDAFVTQLLNEHQLSDKGFGAALGPAAARHLANRLQNEGKSVQVRQSDWSLDKQHNELQLALIEGWLQAASEQDSAALSQIQAWYDYRVDKIRQSKSDLTVSHLDLLCL